MDTEALRDMAGLLRTVASEVEIVADQQAKQAHAAHWVSASGDIFRDSSLTLRGTLQENGAHLLDTAARLEAVANTVDDRVAAIAAAAAAAAAAAEEFADDVYEAGTDIVESIGDGASELADDVEDAVEGVGDRVSGWFR